MKLIHLSDLHIGKRWGEYSLIDDQKYILKSIVEIIKEQRADGVMIAGDIYDKTMPPAEAVELFDNFLVELLKLNVQVFVISGNHDSAERIAFGGRIMDASGIHMSPVFEKEVSHYTLFDDYGAVNIYALPFIKPVHVKKAYPELNGDINSYQSALKVVVDNLNIDESQRNVLITHQFITGAKRYDSEDIVVGGTDNIDANIFNAFDYVALGHIHGPQNIGSEKIRYCGTPLKYSFSEMEHNKSVTVVNLGKKGELSIEEIPLKPLRDVAEIKGRFDDIISRDFYEGKPFVDCFLRIILTDEEDVLNAQSILHGIYPNMLELRYDNLRTRNKSLLSGEMSSQEKTPIELCGELFTLQNGKEMTDEQKTYLQTLIEEIWGNE